MPMVLDRRLMVSEMMSAGSEVCATLTVYLVRSLLSDTTHTHAITLYLESAKETRDYNSMICRFSFYPLPPIHTLSHCILNLQRKQEIITMIYRFSFFAVKMFS
jgi:hypothetical protein